MEVTISRDDITDDFGRKKMKRFMPLILLMTMLQTTFGFYMYIRGGIDGIIVYKHSKNFYLTLESMYRFGFIDGAASCGKK